MLGGATSHPSEKRRRRMWQDVLIRTRGVKQQRGEETPAFTSGVRVKVDLINCCTLNFFFYCNASKLFTQWFTPPKHFSDMLPRYEPPNLSGLLGRVCLPSTGPKQNPRLLSTTQNKTQVPFEFLLFCFYILS